MGLDHAAWRAFGNCGWLLQVEGRQGAQDTAEASSLVRRPPVWAAPRRQYPELASREPALDDEDVFGPAWPLIVEWRGLKGSHPNRGKGLSWLVTEDQFLSVELALLEEHGLTLPPETYPLRGSGRNAQRNWREAALYDTRRVRAWAELRRWVRRALTLGLWKN